MGKFAKFGLLVLLFVFQFAGDASAQCASGINTFGGTGTMRFGRMGNGVNHQYAQQFPVMCGSQLTLIRLQIYLPAAPDDGILPLAVSDTLQCIVLDPSGIQIMSKDYIISEATGHHDIDFYFSSFEFALADDIYTWVINIPQSRYANIWWGGAMEAYDSHYIDDGTWFAMDSQSDFGYYVAWDINTGYTATTEETWDSLKAIYR